MLKNKAPQEQPANPVERDREETQWLMERLRKIGFNSNQPFAVFMLLSSKKCHLWSSKVSTSKIQLRNTFCYVLFQFFIFHSVTFALNNYYIAVMNDSINNSGR